MSPQLSAAVSGEERLSIVPTTRVSRWNLGEPVLRMPRPQVSPGQGRQAETAPVSHPCSGTVESAFRSTRGLRAPHICLSVRRPVCHFVLPRDNDDADWPSDSLPPQSEDWPDRLLLDFLAPSYRHWPHREISVS